MKKQFFTLSLMLLAIALMAQTKNSKLGVSVGFGFQQYKGDLGNGFYNFKTSKYGVASANVGFYLNKSFDVGLIGTIGDYGYCQTDEEANREISTEERCAGCLGRAGVGNLSSRMTSGGFILRYKIANGYLFKEDSKLQPYIYLGTCINHITDIMKMNCINPGDYFSINAGIGFKYSLNKRFNLGYNVALGYFTNDHIDYKMKGANDMYMQNTIFLGVNLFENTSVVW